MANNRSSDRKESSGRDPPLRAHGALTGKRWVVIGGAARRQRSLGLSMPQDTEDTEDTHQVIAQPSQHAEADGPVHESSPDQSDASRRLPWEASQRARGAPAAHEKPFVWTIPTVRTAVDQILASLLAGTLSFGGQRISAVTIVEETVDILVVRLQMAAGGSRLMSFALYPLPSPICGFPVDSAPLNPPRVERDRPTQEQGVGVGGDDDDVDDDVDKGLC